MTSYRNKLVGGLVLLVALIGLGFAVKTSALTRRDISMDEEVAAWRDGALTALAKGATHAASSTVGMALTLLIPAALWLLHRRWDAVRTLLVMGGALAVAFVVKVAVSEHRPPRRLWVIPPDNAQSFPSGHTTVAAALALAVVLLVRGPLRVLVALAGLAVTAVVAFARVYLGVHYVPDVIGGALSAVVAALLACALMELPPVRGRLDALEAGSGGRGRHAGSRGR
ncbi:phosphatase PAP2 family protein [Streptomyces orinoci]|uniref:Phosphatase PAP2 family protein n=1 Tax=Streptomyces orinoci TaxID=67339 RepID=A0ABV3K0I2_STRON|nr:phosphatase PAP2 family protein [Streptomyces orinoci]